jgi:hypothetical protein
MRHDRQTLLALSAVVAMAGLAAPAAAQPRSTPIIPGYWESTNRLLSPVRTSKTERRCLTPADVDKFLAGPSNHHYDCDYPTRVVENGRIRMAGTCVSRKKGRKVAVTGQGNYTPTSFHLTATIATEFAGIPISGRASTDARRIGDTCPDAALGTTLK